jgi:predicted lipid-binding transport protein (Tim44 family)
MTNHSVEFLGLALIAVVFIVTTVVMLLRFAASVVRASAQAQTDPSQPHLTDLRLLLQHNDPVGPLAQQLKPITTVDPQFSSASFAAWAADAFTRVFAYDGTTPVTELPVTAAMATRLGQEAQTLQSGGCATTIRDVRLDPVSIQAVRVDEQRQSIDVRLSGTRVRFVTSADGRLLEGSTNPVPFSQLATFARPAGARSEAPDANAATLPAVGLSHCPHCGGDVTTGIAQCPFCGTALDQRCVPWLIDTLAEAPVQSQAPELAHAPTSASLGLLLRALGPGDHGPTTIALGKNLQAAVEQIHSRDPNFSQERFMRWATQAYLQGRASSSQPLGALQKSDFFGVIITDTTEYIIALFSSLPSGKKVVEAVVYSRPLGSLTPPAPTAAPDTLCSNCGAALRAGAAACDFCGTLIPDSEGDWKVEKIGSQGAHITASLQFGR